MIFNPLRAGPAARNTTPRGGRVSGGTRRCRVPVPLRRPVRRDECESNSYRGPDAPLYMNTSFYSPRFSYVTNPPLVYDPRTPPLLNRTPRPPLALPPMEAPGRASPGSPSRPCRALRRQACLSMGTFTSLKRLTTWLYAIPSHFSLARRASLPAASPHDLCLWPPRPAVHPCDVTPSPET